MQKLFSPAPFARKYWATICHRLCLFLICSLLAGCASSNRDYNRVARQDLQPGISMVDVVKKLGKPQKVVQTDSQKTLACYYSWRKDPRYTEPKTGYDGPTSVQVLSLRYDASGKLEESLISEGPIIGNLKIRAGVEAGTFVQELDTSKMVPQQTKLSELIAHFGQPTGRSIGTAETSSYHWVFVDTQPTGSTKIQELTVSTDSTGKVTQVVTDENLTLPANMLPSQDIKTLQPDYFRRESIPPKAGFF